MGIIAAFAVPHPPLLVKGVGDADKVGVQKTQTAFEEVGRRCAALKPETLVFFSPHATLYADYFHISPGVGAQGSFAQFGAPGAAYAVAYDQEFVHALEAELARLDIPGGTEGEREPALDHGVMVPLFFIGNASGDEGGAGKGVQVVRMGLSGLGRQEHRECGAAVARVAEALERKTVIIASGDLSHKLLASGPYGFAPEGPEFDKQVVLALERGSAEDLLALDEELAEAAGECGLRSFIMMAGALEWCAEGGHFSKPELLSYEGPFGVGYAVAAYAVEPVASEAQLLREESLPVALARKTLMSFFGRGGERPTLETPDLEALLKGFRDNTSTQPLYNQLLHKRAGAFVSLHEHGELRGCIGTIAATKENVLAEIIHNAVSAAREDPRFPPVEHDELPFLDIKVDILGDAEPVQDRSLLDAERYGVIVSLGYRRGLLLPALEGVDTPDEQIAIALSKAGIGADEPYKLERFEVKRYT